jgi:hypothetical protein
MPRNFVLTILLYTYLYNQWSMQSVAYSLLQLSLYLFFSRFRINFLAANHSIIRERTRFDVAEKSLKFLLEIMTLVSSANNIGFTREFILDGRSFI